MPGKKLFGSARLGFMRKKRKQIKNCAYPKGAHLGVPLKMYTSEGGGEGLSCIRVAWPEEQRVPETTALCSLRCWGLSSLTCMQGELADKLGQDFCLLVGFSPLPAKIHKKYHDGD